MVVDNFLHFFVIHTNSFSYNSRKALLDRVAFGVSRSTLRQQDSKVNIGRLRQRMTSLRARAVELASEAFSGGAEDPTALQLQADELYGMEEVRIRATRSSWCLGFLFISIASNFNYNHISCLGACCTSKISISVGGMGRDVASSSKSCYPSRVTFVRRNVNNGSVLW